MIRAFEEAVQGMRAGGLRRIEVPGDHPELGYPRDRSLRFTDDSLKEGKLFKYMPHRPPTYLIESFLFRPFFSCPKCSMFGLNEVASYA